MRECKWKPTKEPAKVENTVNSHASAFYENTNLPKLLVSVYHTVCAYEIDTYWGSSRKKQ